MTELVDRVARPRIAAHETALHAVTTANNWVLTAKRTRSPRLVECAERDLQSAVDRARELGVQWGQIGVTLGIARGNAYQRYRKRVPHNDFRDAAPHVRIA